MYGFGEDIDDVVNRDKADDLPVVQRTIASSVFDLVPRQGKMWERDYDYLPRTTIAATSASR
jgi:hypothetical protein